jgi:pimeloyl-ACP methyl ester carboxylesterase
MPAGLEKLSGLDDWLKQRKRIEGAVQAVLQRPADNAIDLQVKVVDEFREPGYVRRRINYFVDDWTRISAWLLVPDEAEEEPAIICMHSKTAIGKNEPAGVGRGDPELAFAKYYAERGYVTLAPDSVAAGERIYSRCEAFDTKPFYKENGKLSVLGKMLHDHVRCVDALSDLREVDPARIGVIGHGLGGLNAIMLAAFDSRVRACVSSCAITSMTQEGEDSRWTGSNGFVLAPKIGAALEKGEPPFDWDEIMALCAPTPLMIIAALNDETLPHPESCSALVDKARKVYGMLGEKSSIELISHRKKHSFPAEAQDAADAWLDRWI